ncbi:tyrosine-type recombinase/integrase [Mycolicibacterium novocastrense]|uniref:Tyrosine-type recombinase/integrase n=1 Tax=Mycolicibacterium novocastrense TaxID=59813 RepID=A0AAW5SE32_MYCNV|nr:tyrosine-type recombinase/integrase [Mycolicibacterium novocastrense]
MFTDDEVRRSFAVIDSQPMSSYSNKAMVDPVLFRVLYGAGLRISEALNLTVSDVDTQSGTLKIRDSKTVRSGPSRSPAGWPRLWVPTSGPRTRCPNPTLTSSTAGRRAARSTRRASTSGSAAIWPTPKSRISPAARIGTRCVTDSPSPTCGAGPKPAPMWPRCCPTWPATWATPTCAAPSTTCG